MAQFDVYENLSKNNQGLYPYLLDIQHSIHERLDSHMVIPLTQMVQETPRLSLSFSLNGKSYVAVVPDMVGLPVSLFGKKVDNFSKHSSEIIDAVDFLITGF